MNKISLFPLILMSSSVTYHFTFVKVILLGRLATCYALISKRKRGDFSMAVSSDQILCACPSFREPK